MSAATRSPDEPDDRGVAIHPIEVESYAIMDSRVDLSTWPDPQRAVVARMIHATADETFAQTARIGDLAVRRAVEGLRRHAPVICDARMVVAGVAAAARLTSVECYLDQTPAAPEGGTRSAAAVDHGARLYPEGAIWVFGNAPTALARLIELHATGVVSPLAVVGVPVGYVGAAEAKEALWSSDLRPVAITNSGRRGGSPVAAAAVNALVRLALADRRSPTL